jgi:hypothetical protein
LKKIKILNPRESKFREVKSKKKILKKKHQQNQVKSKNQILKDKIENDKKNKNNLKNT